jgi:hypothetical protein
LLSDRRFELPQGGGEICAGYARGKPHGTLLANLRA